jgi:peptidyl-prolyl cis-trans isomerase SurA
MQIRTLGLVSVLTALAAGLAQAQPAPAPSFILSSGDPSALIIERILVKINGELFSQSDLEEAQVAELRLLPTPPQTDAELRRAMQELTPELVATMIDDLLLMQRGREMGFTLSDAQFDEILDGIKVENGFDDEELVTALAESEGMSLADLRGTMEERMLVQQVQQFEVNSRIVMTGTEAREYYDEHLDEFSNPATVTLREIVVGLPAGTGPLAAAGAERAKAAADATHSRVTAGEDFAAVAEEASTAASKANGGLIGPVNLLDLADAIRDRVEALEVGEISTVTETAAGYQILKLEARTDASPIPFDGLRDSIVQSVAQSRQAEALNDYLELLREAAIIEWKDENLKQIYEAVVAARVAASGV